MAFKNFITNKEITLPLKQYVENWCVENNSLKIAVGTDSHLKKNGKTVFVTAVIMYHSNNKGCHVIYSKDIVNKKFQNLFNKLWSELTYTKSVAENLIEINDIELEIHIDINENESEGSYIAYPSAVGMFKGMGYNVLAKPNAPAASTAGDYLANKERKRKYKTK